MFDQDHIASRWVGAADDAKGVDAVGDEGQPADRRREVHRSVGGWGGGEARASVADGHRDPVRVMGEEQANRRVRVEAVAVDHCVGHGFPYRQAEPVPAVLVQA
nr:hypothetical protein [Candidatus Protofrankia californiensis]